MKKIVLELLLQMLLQLISSIIDKAEEKDKADKEEREKMKKDLALAKNVRSAFPTMSDENILKSLC